jgi:hypothetical protein
MTAEVFPRSVEIMAAQRDEERDILARAVAQGGRLYKRGAQRARVYFEIEHIAQLTGLTHHLDELKAELRSVYFEPFYGWHVLARKSGPYRLRAEDILTRSYEFHFRCSACHDTGEIAVVDVEGQYDGMEPCTCDAGRAVMAATLTTPYAIGRPF